MKKKQKIDESYFDLTGRRTFFANPYADPGVEFDDVDLDENDLQDECDEVTVRALVREIIETITNEEI